MGLTLFPKPVELEEAPYLKQDHRSVSTIPKSLPFILNHSLLLAIKSYYIKKSAKLTAS
jgi:hypothetical protein